MRVNLTIRSRDVISIHQRHLTHPVHPHPPPPSPPVSFFSGSAERASSLDHLCSQRSPGLRGHRGRLLKTRREADRDGDGQREEGLMSPAEEDVGGYGAFTLPCRRSHCLSEGLAGLGIPAAPCPAFQGRRAQTTQVRSQRLEHSF